MTIAIPGKNILAEACGPLDPASGLDALIACVNARAPGLTFGLVLTERDWYRLGGVVDADGKRVSEDLRAWVEDEADGDVIDFVARFQDAGLQATALTGRTHFLSAPTGEGLMDFVQIEIEETQEMVERPLLVPGVIPDTVEDVIDPSDIRITSRRPLGDKHYRVRRVTPFAERMGDLTSQYTGDPRLARFLEEWSASSAADTTRFSAQWAMVEFSYLDSQGDHLHEVKLLTPHAPMVDNVDIRHLGDGADGERLADLVHGID
ncbi:MAG: hypothetical protein HQL35_14460, partial [Alphaproteobacteria bacterium]|nr:hypothetical protein [Alphaproteobacteria bacterium]